MLNRIIVLSCFCALCFFVTGCTVKYKYLQPGYRGDGKGVVKRIALLVEPKGVEVPGLAEAIVALQREYLSVESTYILPSRATSPTAAALGREKVCADNTGLEGVLLTEVRKLEVRGAKVALGVRTVLFDCSGKRVWDSYAESVHKSEDSDRRALVKTYTERFGEKVVPYIIPMYETIRVLLESIPRPKLAPGEENERIQNFLEPPRAKAG